MYSPALVGEASSAAFGGAAPRIARHKSSRWENRHLAESIPDAAPREHRASRAEAARKPEFQRRDLKNVSYALLPPDVLASRNRIEDAIPSRLEVKRRHIQNEHRILPPRARSEKLPPIRTLVRVALATLGSVHVSSHYS
jgi:hypothetical protein